MYDIKKYTLEQIIHLLTCDITVNYDELHRLNANYKENIVQPFDSISRYIYQELTNYLNHKDLIAIFNVMEPSLNDFIYLYVDLFKALVNNEVKLTLSHSIYQKSLDKWKLKNKDIFNKQHHMISVSSYNNGILYADNSISMVYLFCHEWKLKPNVNVNDIHTIEDIEENLIHANGDNKKFNFIEAHRNIFITLINYKFGDARELFATNNEFAIKLKEVRKGINDGYLKIDNLMHSYTNLYGNNTIFICGDNINQTRIVTLNELDEMIQIINDVRSFIEKANSKKFKF